MNVTIKDVAKCAGVSVSTVSRVINGFSNVDTELKQKVNEAIESLGYKPNSLARGLKNKVTNTIGVVVSDIANPFFIGVTRQIEKMVMKQGYSMLMVSTDSDPEKEINSIQMMEEKQVDGMIICPDSNTLATSTSKISCPVVAIDRKVLSNIYDSVYVDKEQSIYNIIKYLISKGHTNIAMITGTKKLSSNYDRFCGYIRAHYDCGMEVNNKNILFGKFSMEFGEKAFAQIISASNCPTAIISGSTVITAGIMVQAKRMNISIPNDISLISFGELEMQQLITPKVTYIEDLQTEIGRIAGEMIISRVNNPDLPIRRQILNAKIIEGDSVKKLN